MIHVYFFIKTTFFKIKFCNFFIVHMFYQIVLNLPVIIMGENFVRLKSWIYTGFIMCTIKISLLFNAQNTPTFKRMKLMTSTKTREDKMDTECPKDEGPRSLSRAEIELQYFREVFYINFYIICRKHKCINILFCPLKITVVF